jgi:hypothetical protein
MMWSCAVLQAEIVTVQVATVGERRRRCAARGRPLASKGHDPMRPLYWSVVVNGVAAVSLNRMLDLGCPEHVRIA